MTKGKWYVLVLINCCFMLFCTMSKSMSIPSGTWFQDTNQLLKTKVNKFSERDREVLKQKRGICTLQNRWFDPELKKRIQPVQGSERIKQKQEKEKSFNWL